MPSTVGSRLAEAESAEGTTLDEAVGADAYRVSLPMFDGPLDLLLHLIKKHELDILDIPVAFVSKKYNEYLRAMEELSIDLAAEYLVMAATLAYIKSKMLLPPDPTQTEDEEDGLEEEADPRAELIRRLLEYQKYKDAAEQLGGRDVLGRDLFPRGIAMDAIIERPPLAQLSLFKLVDAFESVLKRAKISEDHQIDFERITISEKIGHISDRLQKVRRLQFEELFDGDVSRAEMIVTFLALLEMTKLRMTNISQDGPMAPIIIELAVRDESADEADTEWPELQSAPERSELDDDVLSVQRSSLLATAAVLDDSEWEDADDRGQPEGRESVGAGTVDAAQQSSESSRLEPFSEDVSLEEAEFAVARSSAAAIEEAAWTDEPQREDDS